MDLSVLHHRLQFKEPGGTSRGVLHHKDSWFIIEKDGNELNGVGECSLISGLSIDKPESVTSLLRQNAYSSQKNQLPDSPAVQFGLEIFEKSRRSTDPFTLFDSKFSNGSSGIPINGLIWMGTKSEMHQRITEKIASGFSCLKLKIGAIDFNDELSLLQYVRSEFSQKDIEIRVDANGAFTAENAEDRLSRLSEYHLHSIEQPIKPGQWEEMAKLCERTPLPIALDEELIGIADTKTKQRLLTIINPQFIILKPSLVGGFNSADEWISLSESRQIGWWATSALESNIGLNAIAQWVARYETHMPQGLGTGGLYTNNISSPLEIRNGALWYNLNTAWDDDFFE